MAPLPQPRLVIARPAARPRALPTATTGAGLRSSAEADPSPVPPRLGCIGAACSLTDGEFGTAAIEMEGASAALGVAFLLVLAGAPLLSKCRRRGVRADHFTAPPGGPARSTSVVRCKAFRDDEIGRDAETSLLGPGPRSSSSWGELAAVSPLQGDCVASIATAEGHAIM
jgi:hypothetical protein